MNLISDLENYLIKITGFDAVSMQPNSGAQGEYAGLLAINNYHKSRGEGHRNVCLIPSSAHGTNPASATMTSMKSVIVKCDEKGNIDVKNLQGEISALLAPFQDLRPHEEYKRFCAGSCVGHQVPASLAERFPSERSGLLHPCKPVLLYYE